MADTHRTEDRVVADLLVKLGENGRTAHDPAYITLLKAGLAANGQQTNLQVTPMEKGEYEVFSGFGRLQAGRELGFTEWRVTVHYGLDALRRLALQLSDDIFHAPWPPLDRAAAYERLVVESGLPAAKVAEKYGLDASLISRYRALLTLDEESRARLAAGALSFVQAYGLVKKSRKQDGSKLKRLVFKLGKASVSVALDAEQVGHEFVLTTLDMVRKRIALGRDKGVPITKLIKQLALE